MEIQPSGISELKEV